MFSLFFGIDTLEICVPSIRFVTHNQEFVQSNMVVSFVVDNVSVFDD